MKKWLCVLACCVATSAWAAPVEIAGMPAARARVDQHYYLPLGRNIVPNVLLRGNF